MCQGEAFLDERVKATGQRQKSGRRIRLAVEGDLDQMAAIESGSIPNGWSREAFTRAFENDQALLLVLTEAEFSGGLSVRRSDVVLAYLVCYFAADEGEIVSIACHPEARRRGCAADLLAEFRERARDLGLSGIFLEVRKSNAAAIHLYERAGFVFAGRRPRFYRNPEEDALLLRLDLSEKKEKPC